MRINVEKKLRKIEEGRTDGFSAIELIMAIAIIGIFTAVALPRLNINNVDLFTAIRQARSDIRYTQELAMSKFAIRTIRFVGGGNTYQIEDSGGAPLEDRELPGNSRVIFDAGSPDLVFTFNSIGEPIVGGGGSLVVSSGGSTEQLIVAATTGAMTIP